MQAQKRNQVAELEALCDRLARQCEAQEKRIAELEKSFVMVAEIVRNNNDHLHSTMLSVVEHDHIIKTWQQYEQE